MGNVHLVTGYAGKAHVTAADHGALFEAAFRSGQFVLNSGTNFAATIVSNNEIRFGDGEGIMQGRYFKVDRGSSVSVHIENGAQGKLRNDLIVARYTKDAESGVEDFNIIVLKGASVESGPSDPEYVSGDINAGNALINDLPMYRIPLNGLNVGTPIALFDVVYDIQTQLNGKAAASHGNHVPTPQTADNAKFLRNDNSWQTVTPANIGAAAASHGNHVPTPQTADNAKFLRNDNSWQTVTPANIGAAAASHGNHVPTTQTANNAKFLRNDNTWQTVTPANIGAAPSSHNHSASNITSGTLPIARGGTEATSAANARSNLGVNIAAKIDKVWTNGSPTSSFAAQTVASGQGNNILFWLIEFAYSTAMPTYRWVEIVPDASLVGSGEGICRAVHVHSSDPTNVVSRIANGNGNSGVTFEGGFKKGSADNTMAIPYRISVVRKIG